MVRVPVAPQVDLQVAGLPAFQGPAAQGPIEDVSARVTQQMGQAQTQLGIGIQRIAQRLQDDINEAEAKRGDVQIADKIESTLYADDGLFAQKGLDGLGEYRKRASETLRAESQKIAEAMPNTLARKMYERSASSRIERAENQMTIYAFQQSQKAKQDETANRMTRLGRDVVMFSNDWSVPNGNFAKSRAVWEQEFSEFIKGQGIQADSDAALVLRENLLSPMHEEIVRKMLQDGRTKDAEKYLETYGGSTPLRDEDTGEPYAYRRDMNSATVADLQGKIQSKRTSEDGAELAVSVVSGIDRSVMEQMTKAGTPVAESEVFGGDSYRMAIEEIERRFALPEGDPAKIDDGMRRVALAEVENVHARRKNIWMDKGRMALERAETLLSQDNNLRIMSSNFPADLREDLKKYGKLNDAARVQGGMPRETSDRDYREMLEFVSSGRLKTQSQLELYDRFYAKLSRNDWNALLGSWEDSRKGQPIKKRNIGGSDDKIVESLGFGAVYSNPDGPQTELEKSTMTILLRKVREEVLIREANGQEVSDTELQNITNSFLNQPKVTYDPGMWSFETQVFPWMKKSEDDATLMSATPVFMPPKSKGLATPVSPGGTVQLKVQQTGFEERVLQSKMLARESGVQPFNEAALSYLAQTYTSDELKSAFETARELARVRQQQDRGSSYEVAQSDVLDALNSMTAAKKKKMEQEERRKPPAYEGRWINR
jgi:hypothetical protein